MRETEDEEEEEERDGGGERSKIVMSMLSLQSCEDCW